VKILLLRQWCNLSDPQVEREITTEITRKQKEILESLGKKPEHVPTFLKS
jgi:translation initiation factor 2 beta subunit (eIF-2beta)/eIF-5